MVKNIPTLTHHMNKFCDSGKIIASKKIKISLSDNGETLSDKIIINGLSILKNL